MWVYIVGEYIVTTDCTCVCMCVLFPAMYIVSPYEIESQEQSLWISENNVTKTLYNETELVSSERISIAILKLDMLRDGE